MRFISSFYHENFELGRFGMMVQNLDEHGIFLKFLSVFVSGESVPVSEKGVQVTKRVSLYQYPRKIIALNWLPFMFLILLVICCGMDTWPSDSASIWTLWPLRAKGSKSKKDWARGYGAWRGISFLHLGKALAVQICIYLLQEELSQTSYFILFYSSVL